MNCTYMTYRVSITEGTMERLKRYVRETLSPFTADTLGESGRYAYTVDDVICMMLDKAGF